ncbi:hypothetical protein WJX84_007287 [Apatococcus fuscideae]|uniref:Uncharacterized protein n=1 Tax=Apatococcus fuscideae TaxID=2026836 RepID=A0AAW1S8N2_9CHLO
MLCSHPLSNPAGGPCTAKQVIAHVRRQCTTASATTSRKQQAHHCSFFHTQQALAPCLAGVHGIRRQPSSGLRLAIVKATGDDALPAPSQGGFEAAMGRLSTSLANWFPLWVAAGCLLALWHPPVALWFRKDYVTAGLAITMLAMGTTVTLQDLTDLLKFPGRVVLGAALQYTIMPLMGFAVSRLAGLSTPYAIGICTVASCPGGTASNVVAFLARADVALSVMMTTVSTLAAAVATPLLTQLLVGTLVPVDALALTYSTFQVVVLPVLSGAWLNQQFPRAVKRAAPFAPLVAVVMVALICASIVAQNAAAVKTAGLQLLAAICALHLGGFGLGYFVSRGLGIPERQARTNSIEAFTAAAEFHFDLL